ncbi:XXYS1_4_G0020250.mRNA.1.CDS.1 [Saccharomyces cerevisiae]|nr:EM14S01-3B_G0017710.mRNA.1.CDS.1 [Saccharomyces cerevisiae]CAD6649471.1 XXYS1_4_G0020250.mRNA.1.CDS.1 [Saccharomyces cerevisiae]CAI4821875.1 CEI_1a_G0053330.mRNA.1.CDS.1 [Saccharomyces cerevisiae]CAI4829507.1 AMH_1a_G0053460.mRNA.1.CDS.1 [Saccharomyces cerevisiae]CAI6899733.1 AMH_1a_G0053460.mRNA.1.CDS.1 [Saccharomyces cerevisiae]
MIFKILCSLLLVISNFASALYVNETTSYTPYTKTLTPTYSVSPQETTLTYSDETTTFYITSTFYSTYWFTTSQSAAIISTPTSSTPTASTPSLTTSTNEYTTIYSNTDTTYTSTLTSTYIITLSTESVNEKAEQISTSVTEIASTVTESGSTYISTLTSTLLVTVYNSQASNTIATSTAGDAASNVDALEKLVSAEHQSQTIKTTSADEQYCSASTKYVTVTAAAVTQVVTTTAELVVKYVTITADASNVTSSANNGTHI